jgi:hypothetical protein
MAMIQVQRGAATMSIRIPTRRGLVAAVPAMMLFGAVAGAASAQDSQAFNLPSAAEMSAAIHTAASAPIAMPGNLAANGGVAVTDHIAAGSGNAAIPSGSEMPPMVSNGMVANADRP